MLFGSVLSSCPRCVIPSASRAVCFVCVCACGEMAYLAAHPDTSRHQTLPERAFCAQNRSPALDSLIRHFRLRSEVGACSAPHLGHPDTELALHTGMVCQAVPQVNSACVAEDSQGFPELVRAEITLCLCLVSVPQSSEKLACWVPGAPVVDGQIKCSSGWHLPHSWYWTLL